MFSLSFPYPSYHVGVRVLLTRFGRWSTLCKCKLTRGWLACQLSFWLSDDVCSSFPTLYFDVFVDTFFLVRTSMLAVLLRRKCRNCM
jgi:hypothetical protein